MDLLSIILIVAAAAVVGWMIYKGHFAKASLYIAETREELRKCTWPSTDELKGSTGVVMIAIVLLGAFTVGADFALALFVRLITSV
jgi:preprotein translocase subunit SecE